MTKRQATMTIRVSSATLAALDILVGELRAVRGQKVTQDEAIWSAIEEAKPHIIARVQELQPEEGSKKQEN